MIRVWYYYHTKNNRWFKSYKDFYDVRKALRFIKAIDAEGKESFVDCWECDDPWDNNYLYQRHTLNGGHGKVWIRKEEAV